MASAVVFGGALLAVHASGQRLRSPWDFAKVFPANTPYNCPAPPEFSRTLNLDGYYTDNKYSIIDQKKLAQFNENSAGPTHLGQYASLAADAWLSTGSRPAAACVYSLLAAAAQADAWDGKMPQINGIYMQNWLLSGTAIAYLKVRGSGAGTPDQDAIIEKWLRALAGRVQEYFDNGRKSPRSDAWNNRMYWAGLSVASEGIAANDPDSFIWGLTAYEMGIHAIQPDGSLDAEMGRGRMALHYQLYALGPLILLAEFAQANSIDLYREREGAIHRLVKFDVAAMRDPSLLEKRTGEKQNIAPPYSGLEIGWAVPYVRRFPSASLTALIAQAPTLRFWQWGGAPPPAVSATAGNDDAPACRVALKHKIEAALAVSFPPGLASSYFLGKWCADGRSDLPGSIQDAGDVLTIDNGQGSVSEGELHGPLLLVAPQWGSIAGAITPDHSQIDWTNGTYWVRCPSASSPRRTVLTGSWIGRAGACSIRQQGKRIRIGPTGDCRATGYVDENGTVTLDFYGTKVEGLVTPDGNHINWQDLSYWTRANVYRLEGK